MALRVVWPTFKPLACSKRRGSGSTGAASESSVFECRLVDVRGDSCILRIYVNGDQASNAVKLRGKQLMERFVHSSAWVVSHLRCVSSPKSALYSGCSVQLLLMWSSNAAVMPAQFAAVLQQSPLDLALPHVPLPAAGLGDLECLREDRLVDLCLRLVEVGRSRQCCDSVVADATFVDEGGRRAHIGMWGSNAELAAESVGRIVFAYNILVKPGNMDVSKHCLEKLSMVRGSRIYVPTPGELTCAAQRLLAAAVPKGRVRDLVPIFGCDYEGAEAVETTCAALDACCPLGQVGPLDVGWELFELPGALVVPDRLGSVGLARTKHGNGIFIAAQVVDLSGSCRVRVREEEALRLAEVDTVEDFEQHLREGTLQLSRARVRVRREARGATVHLTVGAVVPSLVVGAPVELPYVTGQGVLPARVADVLPCKFGGLSVQLADAAGHRVVPVAYAVVAVRGTCRAESVLRERCGCARSARIADALPGPGPRGPVDLVALVPLSLTGAFSVNRDEVAIVVVNRAIPDADGAVRELVATHVWKLSRGKEGEGELQSFAQEVSAAHALMASAVASSRKRPARAGEAEEAAALLFPRDREVRYCAAWSR